MNNRISLPLALSAALLTVIPTASVQAAEDATVEPRVVIGTAASSSRAGSIGLRVSLVPRPAPASGESSGPQ